ncbi:Ribonuclease t2 [Thalictrum thalictroides]|uniref:Ribonuclease t2 n=1 Tax=Thalictrum thalictroides TaxID=46969 RepID=A0A7J6WQE4_THATH|nr:Ribonuclease t2 [Thalictrum thalictroides]
MRILHCVLILAFVIFLKNVYCDSSNPSPPLPNSPLSYLSSLPKPKASPFEIPATNTNLDEVHPQAPAAIPTTPKVKSYLLVVQWPPGVCTGISDVSTCKKPWPSEFKIHGFWPQVSQADLPKKSDQFNYNKLQGLLAALRINWPTLKAGDHDAIFWSEQWYKHGIYSEMEQAAYFQKTLELYGNVGKGLDTALDAEGIKRNGLKTYKLQDIEAALQNINDGFTCSVKCVQSKIDNVEQIQEIRFSYTTDFKKQNTVQTSRCTGPNVRFP